MGECKHNHDTLLLFAANKVLSNRYDPTKTTTIRNTFVKEMRRRFRKITALIKLAVIDRDCFGLKEEPQLVSKVLSFGAYALPGDRAFAFTTSDQKIEGFMEWLEQQVDETILEVRTFPQLGKALQSRWTDTYIQSAYRKGIGNAYANLRKAGYQVPTIDERGGIDAILTQPFHADRIGILYTRAFNELKGITATMDVQISRVLSTGLAQGLGPREIADALVRSITKGEIENIAIKDSLGRFVSAQRRAETLARTEIIRAHHQAIIQEYRNWGAEGVEVQAEWTTAGDGRVCPDCASLEGKVYTLDEIQEMIPYHPNCRCMALPVDKTKKKS